MKIDILGAKYEISFRSEDEDAVLLDCDGYCDESIKLIVVKDLKPSLDVSTVKDLEKYKEKVLRHEIAHAFLFESGLTEYAKNETVVEWIAVQAPKLIKAFREGKCIDETSKIRDSKKV